MKKKFWLMQLPIILLICGFVVTVAVGQSNSGKNKSSNSDTIPEKNKKIRDIDDALSELDLSNAEVDKQLKEIDWQKMEKEIQQSMKAMNIDMGKMQAQMEKAMKEIDVAKIQSQVQQVLKDVDVEKMQKELSLIDAEKIKEQVQQTLKEVDAQKIQQEVLSQVNMEKMNKDLEKIKQIDLSKMQRELKNMQPKIQETMKNAHLSIERARKELTDYKTLIDGLDKDGLLSKKENYKIEYANGELIVNGKKVSADILKKYTDLLKGKENFIIKKNADGFNINNEQ